MNKLETYLELIPKPFWYDYERKLGLLGIIFCSFMILLLFRITETMPLTTINGINAFLILFVIIYVGTPYAKRLDTVNYYHREIYIT